MAEWVAGKTGKISAAIWKLNNAGEEKKLSTLTAEEKAEMDLRVPVGVSVELSANEKPRSLLVEGTVTGTFELAVGRGTLKADKVIVKATAGATWSWSGSLLLESTAAEAAKVELGGKELKGALKANSGKYVQGEAVKSASKVAIKGSSTWETAAQELATTGELEASETATFKCGGSTVKGTSILLGTTGSVEDNASTVWEPTAAGGTFNGGSHSFNGTVKLLGKQEVTGANTFAKLQINNRGALAGAGIKFKKGEKQTVTELTTNGTLAEPARLESTVSGESAKLKVPEEQLESWLIVKDIAFETGVLYIPKPAAETANAGGNSIVKPTENFTVAFEAKPSGETVFGKATGTLLLTGTATAAVRNVVSGKATGPLLLTGTAAGSVRNVITAKASGTLLLSGSSSATVRAVVLGKATGELLLTGSSQATLRAVVLGHATGTLLLTGRAKAISATTGKKIFLLVIDE